MRGHKESQYSAHSLLLFCKKEKKERQHRVVGGGGGGENAMRRKYKTIPLLPSPPPAWVNRTDHHMYIQYTYRSWGPPSSPVKIYRVWRLVVRRGWSPPLPPSLRHPLLSSTGAHPPRLPPLPPRQLVLLFQDDTFSAASLFRGGG